LACSTTCCESETKLSFTGLDESEFAESFNMDSNKMYVPNPQKWMTYYKSMAKGYHNPYVDQKGGQGKQIGGSISGNRGTPMVPIEENSFVFTGM
jgi:hypothetical protein